MCHFRTAPTGRFFDPVSVAVLRRGRTLPVRCHLESPHAESQRVRRAPLVLFFFFEKFFRR